MIPCPHCEGSGKAPEPSGRYVRVHGFKTFPTEAELDEAWERAGRGDPWLRRKVAVALKELRRIAAR